MTPRESETDTVHEMRELYERLGLANTIVALVAVGLFVLIIGAGFDFEVNEMLEVFATFAAVALALGAMAAAAHIVGLLLDAIERRAE
ncbi:MAG TPA: hypothetical protein VMR52_06240 [Dehalococcoidia bacterium]|nr:hypothetical protein [Dehalococcoidia bacterium]